MENKKQFIKVKEWFFEKLHDAAYAYSTFIMFERNEEGLRNVEDGYMTILVNEVVSETEKAVRVILDAEKHDHPTTWNTWIPKSCMMVIE